MQIITSKENETVKYIKKLKDKKFRDETNEYIIEGIKLLQEAMQEKVTIKKIVLCEECDNGELKQNMLYEIAKYPCMYVSKKIFLSLSEVTTPQGVLAVVEKGDNSEKIDYTEDIIVALDGIADPGNLGTILRTIDSVGLTQIIVSKDTADCYNPKVVRSTMGAIFRLNIITSPNLVETMKEIKRHKFQVVATSLQTNNSMYDISYQKKVMVIGNEANGVSKEVMDLADSKIKIPMLGKTESLNASVATGILLYEYVRQKITGKNNGK